MQLIEQDRFFSGLGFEKCEFESGKCFKGIDGGYYRVDHFSDCYVIEYAENETQAKYNAFEDDDLFSDSIPEQELIRQINSALRNYTINQADIDEKYKRICDKLGFIPKEYRSDNTECTEDDSMDNPFSVLSIDEKEFLLYNGFLRR